MTARVNAGLLPRTTPTELARIASAAVRSQRQAAAAATVDLSAIPNDSARYRPTIDGPWLRRICERVAADRAAEVLTEDRRLEMTDAIVMELDRLFPADDMAVLQRHAAGALHDLVVVEFGMARGDYFRPYKLQIVPRWLPRRPTYFVHVVRGEGAPVPAAGHLELPAEAVSWFEDMAALHQQRVPKIMAATGWPEKAKARTGRWPLWRDIFDQFHLIGSWVADQQDPARVASDRGGASEPGIAAPSHSGERGK